MIELTKHVTILNPQSTVEVTQKKLALRAEDLRGKVAGLLVVPMSTSGDFIDRIEELLLEKHGVARVVKKWKVNSTRASTPEFLNEIISQSDFAVVGVGT